MASKTFITLSKTECREHYKEVLKASESNWKSGLILAKEEQYGNAMSMAIISSEELVKAIVILMDGKGFEFRSIQGVDVIFRNHQIRYVIAYAMLIVNLFSEELKAYLTRFKSNPNEGLSFLNSVFNNEEAATQQLLAYGLKKLEQLTAEFDWFEKVDIYRQDGFYSDFEDQLKTPIQIDFQTYRQAFERLEKVRAVGLGLIESLISQEEVYLNHFINMRRNFKQKKFYTKIGDALAVLKQTRDNPFIVIKRYFAKRQFDQNEDS